MLQFRKAIMSDAENLHSLINEFAGKGYMLPRSRNAIYENIREFTVITDDGQFVGCGALHIIWDDLAEIRALAIKQEYQGQSLGQKLIAELLHEAHALGIHKVFALTYQVAFFKKSGFHEVTKEEMPPKVWKE